MQDFISLKRSVGYKYNSEPGILKRFDNYLAVHYPETDILSKEAVVGWCCKTMHETAANHCSRASVIRQFSKYLDSIGINTWILPKNYYPKGQQYVPHIYTPDELKRFFAETDKCHYCSSVPYRHLIMPEFFDRAEQTSGDAVTYFNKVYQPKDVMATALKHLYKSKRDVSIHGFPVRAGDAVFIQRAVLQTKNNYQLEWEIRSKYGLCIDKGTGIFNGDMGIIEEINDFAETMTVSFDEGRMVEYPYKLLDELELAYAVTIHKSQGSEYPAVVIPLLSGPRMLMNRNLLYTAVTRAKKCVTIVGNDITFNQMIENNSQLKRYSGLRDRLTEDSL